MCSFSQHYGNIYFFIVYALRNLTRHASLATQPEPDLDPNLGEASPPFYQAASSLDLQTEYLKQLNCCASIIQSFLVDVFCEVVWFKIVETVTRIFTLKEKRGCYGAQ